MSNSFAEFLAPFRGRDDAEAQELFGRFTHMLIALAFRNIDAGLRCNWIPQTSYTRRTRASFTDKVMGIWSPLT